MPDKPKQTARETLTQKLKKHKKMRYWLRIASSDENPEHCELQPTKALLKITVLFRLGLALALIFSFAWNAFSYAVAH